MRSTEAYKRMCREMSTEEVGEAIADEIECRSNGLPHNEVLLALLRAEFMRREKMKK